jgi:hypothetical protein
LFCECLNFLCGHSWPLNGVLAWQNKAGEMIWNLLVMCWCTSSGAGEFLSVFCFLLHCRYPKVWIFSDLEGWIWQLTLAGAEGRDQETKVWEDQWKEDVDYHWGGNKFLLHTVLLSLVFFSWLVYPTRLVIVTILTPLTHLATFLMRSLFKLKLVDATWTSGDLE